MEFVSPWIHTTEKCNLNCHYCYVKGNATISPEIYKALENFLLCMDVDKHLRFAGGEPLLVFDLWEPFARAMLKNKGTLVEVLTNLYQVPESFWSFAGEENVNVSVSVDNGKTVKVLDKSMAEKLTRLRNPWIMTTVTKENINDLDVLAAFIGSNNYGWALTTDYFEGELPPYDDLTIAMLNIVDVLREFNYDFTRISFNNFSVKSGFSGCRAGNEMFAVAGNGDIYKCQTQIGGPNKLGNVFEGYTPSGKCTSDRQECKDCSIIGFCKGWCPLYYKIPNPICNTIKMFANEVLKEVKNAI